MKRLLLPALLVGLILQVTPVMATASTSASASIDWSTFAVSIFDIGDGNTGGTLTWRDRGSYVNAFTGIGNFNSSSGDWTESPISAVDGVASASADATDLNTSFSTPPSVLNASAQADRNGNFTLTANTMAVFSVYASASIAMDAPTGVTAYSWARLEANGVGPFGTDLQHSDTSKLAWAAGVGSPVTESGKLYATFTNLTNDDMDGSIDAFTQVSKYGVIAVPVPEPETYALMLAGLGLVGFMARRRK